MKNIVQNKSGEGYINTAVKIIIAVVVGAVILGGLFLLFRNVILPNTNNKVEEMMNTGTEIQIRKGTNSIEYSYDGEEWKTCTVAGMESGATVNQLVTIGEGENRVFVMSYKSSTNAVACSSTDGRNWVPIYTDSKSIYVTLSGNEVAVRCNDGREYKSPDGITWRMTSTKSY